MPIAGALSCPRPAASAVSRINRQQRRTRLLILLFLGLAVPLFAQNDSTSQLRLIFGGDIMGHSPQIAAATVEKDKIFDYSPCFQFVAPLLQQADLAIGNLEVTLPGKPPYTGYPTFRSPDDLAIALRKAGFNMLVTANNHSNDAGLTGVVNTIKTVQQYGFYQTGTFLDSLHREALYPLLVYKDHFKLAFLNYTYGTNGIPTPKPTIVNLIDEKTIKADLEIARKMEPDFIIVVMHWGNEYQLNESTAQSALAKKMFEWGADLIIGAHPHVVQPIKTIPYQDAQGNQRQGIVAYSLGNFISNQRQPNTDLGLMVEVTLQKTISDNQTRLADCQYIPIFRYIHVNEKGKSQYYALPVSAFETEGAALPLKMPATALQQMRLVSATIRKHLNQFGAVEKPVPLESLAVPAAETPVQAGGKQQK